MGLGEGSKFTKMHFIISSRCMRGISDLIYKYHGSLTRDGRHNAVLYEYIIERDSMLVQLRTTVLHGTCSMVCDLTGCLT